MTDSYRTNLPAEYKQKKLEYLRNLPSSKDKRTIEDIGALPLWVKLALTHREIYGLSYREALAAVGRKKGLASLGQYGASPAAKAWIADVGKALQDSDPVNAVRGVLDANLLGIGFDKLAALEMAKAAGDYAMMDKIASDILDRQGLVKQSQKPASPVIVIHTSPQSIEIPTITSQVSYVDADIEEE